MDIDFPEPKISLRQAARCIWKTLEGMDWRNLLFNCPQFADKCNWDKLDGGDWSWLLREEPQFAGKCDWNKLDGGDWGDLLRRQPQFADKCDWNKLDEYELADLFQCQPELREYYENRKMKEDVILKRPEKIEWKFENYSEEDLMFTPPSLLQFLSNPKFRDNTTRAYPVYPIKKYFFKFNNIYVEYNSKDTLFFICTGRDENNKLIWEKASVTVRLSTVIYSIEELDQFIKAHFEEIFSARNLSELNTAILDALPPQNDTISF